MGFLLKNNLNQTDIWRAKFEKRSFQLKDADGQPEIEGLYLILLL